MKVLFVAEGDHDLGKTGPGFPPHPASGALFPLSRKVSAAIVEGVAVRFTEISLLPVNKGKLDRDLRKTGLDTKVKRAILLSDLKYECRGVVCVVDGDQAPDDCHTVMQSGRDAAFALLGRAIPTALGIAYQSIEAWTLGARSALAEHLGVDSESIKAEYPKGKHIEDLKGTSGIEEHRPKNVIKRIAALAHLQDSTDFRQAIAEKTDLNELKRECPRGFAPFADELVRAFGAS